MEENEMIDYEKKYNEALEKAKELHGTVAAGRDFLVEVFPELAESEDERMCTRCIDLLRKVSAYSGEEYLGVEIADCIIWLQALIKKLKESLHITEICKEDADSFTDEDERIRKGLIEVVSDIAGGWPFEEHRITKKEALAYLEKQKERQDNPNAHEGSWSGLNTISSQDKDTNIDEIAQDYVDGVKEYNPEPTWDLMQTAVCYGYHYREQKEQKPEERFKEAREKYQVEWSEEDERMLKSTIWHISNSLTNGKNTDCKCDLTEWLKEKLKSLRPQSKVELSEDVKRILDDVSHILIGLNYKQVAKEYKQAIEKLLCSRPSWKPSEQEKGALRTAIHILTDERSFPKAAAHLQDILNAFEGKESRKDWKPSEEQMEALEECGECKRCIKELYEQLKKLM